MYPCGWHARHIVLTAVKGVRATRWMLRLVGTFLIPRWCTPFPIPTLSCFFATAPPGAVKITNTGERNVAAGGQRTGHPRRHLDSDSRRYGLPLPTCDDKPRGGSRRRARLRGSRWRRVRCRRYIAARTAPPRRTNLFFLFFFKSRYFFDFKSCSVFAEQTRLLQKNLIYNLPVVWGCVRVFETESAEKIMAMTACCW